MSKKQVGDNWRIKSGILARVLNFAFKRDKVAGFGFAGEINMYFVDHFL